MKTNTGLVDYCRKQIGLPYWWGTFGQVATLSLLEQKKKQYPAQYLASDFKYQLGQRVHDCVGLIKGYLWTNDGKLTYNAAQDKDVSGMLSNCSAQGNISSIPEIPGVLVFMKGHVGVYIGNGEVIEAKGHKYGVCKTKLDERPWTTWGILDWISYEKEKKMNEYEALDYLVEKGRITDKDYWLNALAVVKNLNWFVIKWATKVEHQTG